jgi:hypothetical protein
MRSWIIPVYFCLFFFIIPLQCFVIGNGMGVGIQGAVYRYQITASGESVIPVTTETAYVSEGRITGKTAISIILWTIGTVLLSIATIISLILWGLLSERRFLLLIKTAALAGILYLAAICTQYGILLSGPAGLSFPIGIILMFIFIVGGYHYRYWLLELPVGTVS